MAAFLKRPHKRHLKVLEWLAPMAPGIMGHLGYQPHGVSVRTMDDCERMGWVKQFQASYGPTGAYALTPAGRAALEEAKGDG